MPKFIRLTARGGDFIWINPEKIDGMCDVTLNNQRVCSRVRLGPGYFHDVTETIETIVRAIDALAYR
jgi:hypothetical protein